MSCEQRKYIKKYPFYKKYVCPICEGRGAVECCNADGTDCAPIPCSFCRGQGVKVEKSIPGMVGAGCAVVAVVIALIVLVL